MARHVQKARILLVRQVVGKAALPSIVGVPIRFRCTGPFILLIINDAPDLVVGSMMNKTPHSPVLGELMR